MCNMIKTTCIQSYQELFDLVLYAFRLPMQYEPNNGLSLLEIPALESGDEFEVIRQLEDYMFALTEACLNKADSTPASSSDVDVFLLHWVECRTL